VEVSLRASLTLALDGGKNSASSPGHFTPGERATGTHWIEGQAGPTAGLDTVVKRKIPCPCQESNPGHPAHSLVNYTDQTTDVPNCEQEVTQDMIVCISNLKQPLLRMNVLDELS